MIDNFASRAAEWDSPEKVRMTQLFVRELLRNVMLKSNWKALEIGAGTGLVGLQVLPKVDSVVFEDTSQSMLEMLRSKIDETTSVEIVHGEVFDYKRADIDLVFSCMAFHHIPDIDKTLTHLYSITTPNATIVVGDLRSEDGSFHRFEPIPHRGFETGQLSRQFEAVGFKVVTVYTYNVLSRERIKGEISGYEQFILVAQKV
jgi:Methylase involved in ubiquinone/menaquinone biosynthesis